MRKSTFVYAILELSSSLYRWPIRSRQHLIYFLRLPIVTPSKYRTKLYNKSLHLSQVAQVIVQGWPMYVWSVLFPFSLIAELL